MGKPYKDFLSMHTVGESGCWNYTGTIGTRGYGQIKKTTAHRWYYEQLVGPVDASLEVDHLCRNKTCVNPDHLEPVTPDENKRRMYRLPGTCARRHPQPGKSLTVLERGNPTYRCDVCIEQDIASEPSRLEAQRQMNEFIERVQINTERERAGLPRLVFSERP